MKLASDIGIWEIVAHIEFKFSRFASGTFSTGSTLGVSCGRKRERSGRWRQSAARLGSASRFLPRCRLKRRGAQTFIQLLHSLAQGSVFGEKYAQVSLILL